MIMMIWLCLLCLYTIIRVHGVGGGSVLENLCCFNIISYFKLYLENFWSARCVWINRSSTNGGNRGRRMMSAKLVVLTFVVWNAHTASVLHNMPKCLLNPPTFPPHQLLFAIMCTNIRCIYMLYAIYLLLSIEMMHSGEWKIIGY